MYTRRAWLQAAASGAAIAVVERSGWARAVAAADEVVVYKSPTCTCCSLWVDHLRQAGLRVTARDVGDMAPVKTANGVPSALWSCHTGVADGYVVEGHVPADLIQRLLRERPPGAGLAVPGMPLGSPGMEAPTREPYDVLLFQRDGSLRVYASR